MRHTHIHALPPPHAGSLLPLKSLFEVDKKMLPFPNAQQPQGADDDEDTEDELSGLQLAERLRLNRLTTDAYDTFEGHCQGRNAAINDLSVWARIGEGNNANRVDAFLGGRHVQDEQPGVLGSKMMSEDKRKTYETESEKESRNFRYNSIPSTSLQESGRLFTNNLGPLVRNALANFRREYGAVAESGEYESDNFGILDYFRCAEDELGGLSTDESPVPGRSRFVAKANFYPNGRVIANQSTYTISASFKVCVIKVYDAEEASIERMERELKAYFRVSQLAAADQKSVAKLLAFGAIDLDGLDPRLFIALEYIEDLPASVPTEKAGVPTEETQELELNKVCGILESVGIHHNDLSRCNFKWQIENGRWFIKVFDFDHATFDDDPHNFSVNGISQLAADDTSLEKASIGWSGAAVVLETRMC